MTDSTMVEKVAAATRAKVPYGYGMTDAETVEYARVAIEAMMEWDEAEIRAAAEAYADEIDQGEKWAFLVSAFMCGVDWSFGLRSPLKGDEPRRPGFLSTLTPEQRTEALKGFDGDDTLGDPDSLKGEGE